jgi:D-apionate oxidoisomerase
MKKVVLMGAGGKMGLRLTRNLVNSSYEVKYVEISLEGKARLKQQFGLETADAEKEIPLADLVILAVPDVALEKVSAEVIPGMQSGAIVVTLDPAAALAGKLATRKDLAYFISHPAHPSIFNWEPTREAHEDYFGGIAAKQAIVCALMQGSEENYTEGAKLATAFYAPVHVAHRITVEQMGLLEPALVETLASTCVFVIRQGLDTVIRQGVPAEAARDFLLGHLKIQMAVLFDMIPGAVFSDAANKALQRGLKEFIREDWQKVFEEENVKEQIRAIT